MTGSDFLDLRQWNEWDRLYCHVSAMHPVALVDRGRVMCVASLGADGLAEYEQRVRHIATASVEGYGAVELLWDARNGLWSVSQEMEEYALRV